MKTEEEIRQEIKEIKETRDGLISQGKIEEARLWYYALFCLRWALGECE